MDVEVPLVTGDRAGHQSQVALRHPSASTSRSSSTCDRSTCLLHPFLARAARRICFLCAQREEIVLTLLYPFSLRKLLLYPFLLRKLFIVPFLARAARRIFLTLLYPFSLRKLLLYPFLLGKLFIVPFSEARSAKKIF